MSATYKPPAPEFVDFEPEDLHAERYPARLEDQDLIQTISDETNISPEIVKIVANNFFQEIKKALLKDKIISINNFGKMFISNPRSGKTKERIFVKFKPSKKITRGLNGS